MLEIPFVTVKIMRAVISTRLANVVKIVYVFRVQRSLKRTLTWRSDRPWRQTGKHTSVVRRPAVKITLVDLPVVTPFACELCGIDNAGVNSQWHAELKTVVDHSRNHWTFI